MRLLWLGVVLPVAAHALGGCGARRPPADPPSATRPSLAVIGTPDTELARRENARAAQLIRQRKYDEAEKVLAGALAADLAFGPAHNSLGTVYFHRKQYHRAAMAFDQAVKLMPYQAEPRNNLGLVREHVHHYDDAVAWYERAVALEPDNPLLIYNLARARLRRGDRGDDVRDLLTKLIARDTRADCVAWAREQLVLLKRPASEPAAEAAAAGPASRDQ